MRTQTSSRSRVPVIQQYAQSECGLCCAAMVMEAWGLKRTIRSLRIEIDPGRDGLGLTDIAEILRTRGMQVKFFRAGAKALTRLKLPAILHWNDNHVVVLEKTTRNGARVVDPARGRLWVSWEELEAAFSGLVLECAPGPHFAPRTEDTDSVWAALLRAVKQGTMRPLLCVGALSMLLYSIVLGVPMATERMINGAGTDVLKADPAFQALVIASPIVLYLLISMARAKILALAVSVVGKSLMETTFGRLVRLPYKYFATRSQGELMMRLSSVSQIRDMLSNQVTMAILDLGTLLVALLYISQRSLPLGLVTVCLIALAVLVNVLSWGHMKRRTDQEITNLAQASGIQMEAVSSIAAIKTSGMGSRFFSMWRERYGQAVEHGKRRMELQGYIASLVSCIQLFGPFVILYVGLQMALSGALDLGTAVAAQALAATALSTATSLTSAAGQFVQAQVQVQRIGDILLQPDEPEAFGDQSHQSQGGITAEGLNFTYPGAKTQALNNVSLKADPGEKLAIVGGTGSGKSTLAKVLVGLYPSDSGDIRMDGKLLRDMSEKSFRDALAYVPQDVTLSNRTIAENIDFSAGEPDLEKVREAARAAQILDTVLAMPLGFDTEIREMGANVSGGQKQRIALARALARGPKILVMDEATSALDNLTESKVGRALKELQCTQIIIAHRLSTVMSADRVLVMDQGNVVQTGTPQELSLQPGMFRTLLEPSAPAGKSFPL